MNKRLPENKNLILHTEPYYLGMPVYEKRGPLIRQYLDSTYQTMVHASNDYSRVTGIRCDLRYPSDRPLPIHADSNEVLKAFFGSLNGRIDSNRQDKVHDTSVRYVWCREYGQDGRPHYHVALLFNGHAYRSLGWFTEERDNLYWRICASWASALGISLEEASGLVHIPDNPVYHIGRQPEAFAEFFYRASYLCKVESKRFGDWCHAFGTSRH